MIGTGRVNTVLVGDDLPELGTDLVAALASLDVNNFAHEFVFEINFKQEGLVSL